MDVTSALLVDMVCVYKHSHVQNVQQVKSILKMELVPVLIVLLEDTVMLVLQNVSIAPLESIPLVVRGHVHNVLLVLLWMKEKAQVLLIVVGARQESM